MKPNGHDLKSFIATKEDLAIELSKILGFDVRVLSRYHPHGNRIVRSETAYVEQEFIHFQRGEPIRRRIKDHPPAPLCGPERFRRLSMESSYGFCSEGRCQSALQGRTGPDT